MEGADRTDRLGVEGSLPQPVVRLKNIDQILEDITEQEPTWRRESPVPHP